MVSAVRAGVRGEFIDVGGRALRAVRAGPPSGPLIVLEHGAFGCAADWAVVQERLAAKGFRSLAYDRAGLGHSDPGPQPRDGRAVDCDRLEANRRKVSCFLASVKRPARARRARA